jgi:hypothetical protein
MFRRQMVTPFSGRDAGAAFTSWQCRLTREHLSFKNTYESRPAGRRHFPLPVGAPLSDFEAIAGSYPVYRIDPL